MIQEFINLVDAIQLKELGFDEPCLWFYANNGDDGFVEFLADEKGCKNSDYKEIITAPLYQQAFKWFRLKQYFSEIHIECDQHDGSIGYSYWIWKPNEIEEYSPDKKGFEWSYDSYEEAELECLKRLIEIVKNKNNE